jgi:hypothetical protein
MPGLAPTDYRGQLGEAGQMAKLQLGLALATRGFGAMGAQPRAGEMPISTLGREMLAPLGADAMTVAQQLYDQKLKLKAAEKAQQAALSQAALSVAQAEQAGEIGFKEKLLLGLAGKTPLKPTIKEVDNLQIKRGNDWVNSPGFSVTSSTTGKTSYFGPDNEALHFVKGPDDEPINARIFKTTEGSQYEASESRPIKITPATLALVQEKFGVPLDEELLGEKAFIQTYNPKGDFPDLESYSKLQVSAHTFDLRKPLEGQTVTATELANASEAWVAPTEPSFKENLIVVGADGIALKDAQGRRIQLARGPDNKLFPLGSNVEYTRPKNTKLVPISQFEAVGSGPSATELNQVDRLGAVISEMSRLQAQQQGEGQVYNPQSALFWSQALHLAGEFPYKFVVDPNDRSQDRLITDENVQKIILDKVNYMAQNLLRADFGEQSAKVKSQRVAQAVQRILAPSAYVWFGDKEIPELGYVPIKPELTGAVNTENAKAAMAIMREDQNASAVNTFSLLPYAPSAKALNSNPFRLRVATEHFPDSFGFTGVAGTDSYDPELITQRADTEAGLRNARILPDATRADHRASIQEAAENISKARETQQNKDVASVAEEEVRLRLEFKRALLAFKNAAAETRVAGYFTGTVAAWASRVGFADFIAGEGAEHWMRLTIASDRLSEGLSRRVGREFGDVRISNYDAKAYQKLLSNIKRGDEYNQFLVDDGLALINRELDGFMQLGGKVAYSERLLQQVAEAGIDFSQLKTQMNWHGYGYYGKNRYAASRQQMPSLSIAQRNALITSGNLKDTMYSGAYSIPMINNAYTVDEAPAFGADTVVTRKGPMEFERFLQNRAKAAGISEDAMRERVVRGILSYNVWRDRQ